MSEAARRRKECTEPELSGDRCVLAPGNRGPTGGVPSWLAPLLGHSRHLCWTVGPNQERMATSLAMLSSSELNRCRPHECCVRSFQQCRQKKKKCLLVVQANELRKLSLIRQAATHLHGKHDQPGPTKRLGEFLVCSLFATVLLLEGPLRPHLLVWASHSRGVCSVHQW